MRKACHNFACFFVLQAVNYAAITWNYRAVAQARYVNIGASDVLCAALSFTVIKRVSEAKGRAAMAGYILGGVVGSIVSAWLTHKIYGQ